MLLMLLNEISILICLNIFDDNRSRSFSNDSENFLLNIKFCLKNDRFERFYIAIFHNDIDCLRCHRFHILFSHLSLLMMMTIVSVL
jgi:hypothetical protein